MEKKIADISTIDDNDILNEDSSPALVMVSQKRDDKEEEVKQTKDTGYDVSSEKKDGKVQYLTSPKTSSDPATLKVKGVQYQQVVRSDTTDFGSPDNIVSNKESDSNNNATSINRSESSSTEGIATETAKVRQVTSYTSVVSQHGAVSVNNPLFRGQVDDSDIEQSREFGNMSEDFPIFATLVEDDDREGQRTSQAGVLTSNVTLIEGEKVDDSRAANMDGEGNPTMMKKERLQRRMFLVLAIVILFSLAVGLGLYFGLGRDDNSASDDKSSKNGDLLDGPGKPLPELNDSFPRITYHAFMISFDGSSSEASSSVSSSESGTTTCAQLVPKGDGPLMFGVQCGNIDRTDGRDVASIQYTSNGLDCTRKRPNRIDCTLDWIGTERQQQSRQFGMIVACGNDKMDSIEYDGSPFAVAQIQMPPLLGTNCGPSMKVSLSVYRYCDGASVVDGSGSVTGSNETNITLNVTKDTANNTSSDLINTNSTLNEVNLSSWWLEQIEGSGSVTGSNETNSTLNVTKDTANNTSSDLFNTNSTLNEVNLSSWWFEPVVQSDSCQNSELVTQAVQGLNTSDSAVFNAVKILPEMSFCEHQALCSVTSAGNTNSNTCEFDGIIVFDFYNEGRCQNPVGPIKKSIKLDEAFMNVTIDEIFQLRLSQDIFST